MNETLNHDTSAEEAFARATGCFEANSQTAITASAGFILREVHAD